MRNYCLIKHQEVRHKYITSVIKVLKIFYINSTSFSFQISTKSILHTCLLNFNFNFNFNCKNKFKNQNLYNNNYAKSTTTTKPNL